MASARASTAQTGKPTPKSLEAKYTLKPTSLHFGKSKSFQLSGVIIQEQHDPIHLCPSTLFLATLIK